MEGSSEEVRLSQAALEELELPLCVHSSPLGFVW